ncbi:MAG: aldehyde dehydrogenase family protein [Solirubrobacterales bacterium]|nr:aldehyde dehydrogenase family protein [Solirubrobacterales bacterium]
MEPTATPEAAATTNGKSGGGSARTVEVFNPATGKLIGTVPAMAPDEVTAAVARARAAQPAWEAAGFAERGRILRRAQKWTLDNAERIISTIVAENGKTYEDAQLAEVSYAASAFGFWAKNAPEFLADEKVKSASPFVLGRKLKVRYAPVGVVGVIGPWNYPLTNSFGDCIPALAAGNSVVLKPATLTPMTSLLMAEGLRECGVPEDVFQVTVGEGSSIGNALIDAVDFVMFTGSTEVGRKVMMRAAETLTPTAMELGGKDPMIVLRDANIERAANAAVHYSMQNGGQTCISVERVYVEEPVYDDFVARVTEKMGALRLGVPGGPAQVDVGAMTSESQTDIVEEQVNDAVAHGARAVVGGSRGEGDGNFFEPTLLLDVDHSMEAMKEETFGPTLPVMKVRDADEAIQLANDSPYGLQASVWTKDVARGEELARRIESGVVCVNDAQLNYVALELPMGGWKDSGVGSRHGAGGIRKYTKQQTLLVTKFAPTDKDVHMLPYDSPRKTKLLGRTFKFLWGRGKRD